MIVLPRWGWRVVFFVGVLPAFLTFWVRRYVREPELWLRTRGSTRARSRLGDVFRDGRAGVTVAVTAMNACTLFAWWGFNLWLPGFLSMPAASGGIGLSATAMSWFVIAMQVGMWFGYITFGYVSDAVGRKRAYVTYLVMRRGAHRPLHVAAHAAACCCCSARSSPSSRPVTSAASVP